MRNWHGQSSPFGKWHTGARRGLTLAEFAEWFLATGVWENTGRWLDQALWDASNWFLATGSWEDGGEWDDAEDWDLTGRYDDQWFLRRGRINLFGRWLDSEAWT